MTLITGIIGIAMLMAFLGFMVWWVKALPLIIIVVGVMLLLIYDFVQTLRYGENGAQRAEAAKGRRSPVLSSVLRLSLDHAAFGGAPSCSLKNARCGPRRGRRPPCCSAPRRCRC